MLQQGFGFTFTARLVVVELDDDHQFAAGAVAEDDVAQQSHLLTEVEEREFFPRGIVTYLVTDSVLDVVHEPTPLDGQNLVEGSRDVETDGGYVLQGSALSPLSTLLSPLKLLLRQVALVGTAEVQFVAVLLGLHRAEDGPELGQLNLADACQLIEDLLLLEPELLVVGQVLPLAASADAEVLAEGHGTYLALLDETYDLALGKRVLLAAYLYVADVAGHTPGHEHHEVAPVEQALALGGHGLNRHAL